MNVHHQWCPRIMLIKHWLFSALPHPHYCCWVVFMLFTCKANYFTLFVLPGSNLLATETLLKKVHFGVPLCDERPTSISFGPIGNVVCSSVVRYSTRYVCDVSKKWTDAQITSFWIQGKVCWCP